MNQYWSAIQPVLVSDSTSTGHPYLPVLVTPTYQYWSRREVVLVAKLTSTGLFFSPLKVALPPV